MSFLKRILLEVEGEKAPAATTEQVTQKVNEAISKTTPTTQQKQEGEEEETADTTSASTQKFDTNTAQVVTDGDQNLGASLNSFVAKQDALNALASHLNEGTEMKNVERKIEKLIEETSFRQMNLALRASQLTPEERAKIAESKLEAMKRAGAEGIKVAPIGLVAGGLAGAATGGPMGAIIGAPAAAGAVSLGTAIGDYFNQRELAKMSPQEINKLVKEAQKKYGSEYVNMVTKRK